MKKIILLTLYACYHSIGRAQPPDTIAHPLKVDMNDRSWCIMANTGFQKRFFFGAGLARTHFLGSRHGVYGYDIYTGVNFFPSFKSAQEVATGIRFGADFFGSGFFMGAEGQYLRTKTANDFLFTPRAGIGFSMLYIAYGYSLSTNKFPIQGIPQNSLILQVNMPFYTKDVLTNKASWGTGRKKGKK